MQWIDDYNEQLAEAKRHRIAQGPKKVGPFVLYEGSVTDSGESLQRPGLLKRLFGARCKRRTVQISAVK